MDKPECPAVEVVVDGPRRRREPEPVTVTVTVMNTPPTAEDLAAQRAAMELLHRRFVMKEP